MNTIAFYSYKGGTGRSLALANAGFYLARMGFSVVALDLDLEAPGLHYKYSTNDDSALSVDKGLVDYLDDFLKTGRAPDSLKPYTVNVPVPSVDKPLLTLLPAGHVPSKSYWERLSKINWHDLFYSSSGPGVPLFLELKARIEDELKPDFLLVDSRTGLTEMGGVATTLLADRAVCVVLTTRENLDGTRAVLQSIRRSRRENGQPELDIMVTLSRLSQSDSYQERNHIARVRAILSEAALEPQDTFTCPEVFVLHTESGLELHDSLRVGSGISPDDSILLRDYLKLFAGVVPRPSFEANVGALIVNAREQAWVDPDAAQKRLEELALSFGHPEAYRALLHMYVLRNVSGPVILKTAQRLWELTDNSADPLLWQTLKKDFQPPRRPQDGSWTPGMDFVEAVWRGSGQRDSDFAIRLADAYAALGKTSTAADLLLEVIRDSSWTATILGNAIRMLDASDRSPEATALIQEKRELFREDAGLIDTWAEHALQTEDGAALAELTEPPSIIVRKARPAVAARVYLRSNMLSDASALADEVLRDIGHRHYSRAALAEIGSLFTQLKRSDEFEERITSTYSPLYVEQIRPRHQRPRKP